MIFSSYLADRVRRMAKRLIPDPPFTTTLKLPSCVHSFFFIGPVLCHYCCQFELHHGFTFLRDLVCISNFLNNNDSAFIYLYVCPFFRSQRMIYTSGKTNSTLVKCCTEYLSASSDYFYTINNRNNNNDGNL